MCKPCPSIVYILTAIFFFAACTQPVPVGTVYPIDSMLARPDPQHWNVDSVIAQSKRMFDSCRQKNDADGAFMALIGLTIKCSEKEDFPAARDYGKMAIPWAEKSTIKDAVAWCYNAIGDAYIEEGDYTKALESLYNGIEDLRKRTTTATHVTANIYNDFATVYLRLHQVPRAMLYYDSATAACLKGNLFFQLGNTYTAKGEYYLSVHQLDSAGKYFNALLDIGHRIKKIDLQAIAYTDLAKMEIEGGNNDTAIAYLNRAIDMSAGKYGYIISAASLALVDAWAAKHNYQKAADIAYDIISKNKDRRFSGNYMTAWTKLVDIYRRSADDTRAWVAMDTLLILKDQVTEREKEKAISHAEAKLKAEQGDKKLLEDQLLIAKQKNKIVTRNIWIAGISIGIFILGAFTLFFINNSRNRQRILHQEIQALENEKKISGLRGLVQGADGERLRIARELHDGIGGMLSVALMKLRGIRREQPGIVDASSYNEALSLLGKTSEEIRKTAHNLMPEEVLAKQSFAAAVSHYCTMLSTEEFVVDFQAIGSFDPLTREVKLNVYRIVQELTRNIIKHAQATYVLVQLQEHKGILTLTIEDNGCGFEPEKARSKTGIGLNNISARVASMNGSFDVESTLGSGTIAYVELDLAQQEQTSYKNPFTHENKNSDHG